MSIHFNADEILEMAEQIERNGARFYRQAAEGFTDTHTRQLLLDLAAMEDDHEKTFAAMRKELAGSEQSSTVFDPDGLAEQYLQAMAGSHIFNVNQPPSERLSGKESAEEVLNMAIEAERDSIAFYVGMKEMVPEQLGKAKVDDIIKEEMKHVTLLSKELAALK